MRACYTSEQLVMMVACMSTIFGMYFQDLTLESRFAYVTLLTNDVFLPGALALAHSLQSHSLAIQRGAI